MWHTFPVAFFLQLMPRVASASKLLSLSRYRSVFAVQGAGRGIVEVAIHGHSLHVSHAMRNGFLTGLVFLSALNAQTAQIKGWGGACLVLCARVLAEVQSVRNASFTGLALQSPVVMCCVGGCERKIGKLQDLASVAVDGMNPDDCVTCRGGHATRLSSFVGLAPDANSGHGAELQYWLHVAEAQTGDDSGERHSGVGLRPHARTSLGTSLIRWCASLLHEEGDGTPSCPRVWVGVCHPRNDTLLLRPMCEHVECLHAMRPFQQLCVGTSRDVLASRTGRGDGSAHDRGTTRPGHVPVQLLLRQSGRALAVVTRDVVHRDYESQTVDPEDVSSGVEEVMASVPDDVKVPVPALSSLHEALHNPLQCVQVVPHVPHVVDVSGGVLSRLWLCRRHADNTELKQLQRRQAAVTAAVSQSVQWYWHDGHLSHAYGHECNAQLESAFRNKEVRVTVHDEAGIVHTVALHKWPMKIAETGATVLRTSKETYAGVHSAEVACSVDCT